MALPSESIEVTLPSERDIQHTGPGTIGGRFMRMFWQPVHLAAHLAAGQAKPIRIMGEDFTLYRGEGGEAHCVAFRCAHRGTQLSTGWVEGDEIRCFYHGWKYRPDGQCTEQPAEPEPFCTRIKIRGYSAREYLGLIFVYFGEGEPPELPRYPEFETPDLIVPGCFIRESNLLTHLDNIFHHAHVPFVHGLRSGYHPGQGIAEETDWGVADRIVETDGRVRYSHFGMPNICELRPNLQGGRPGMQWGVPIDDARHWNFHVRAGRTSEEADALRQNPGPEDPDTRAFVDEQASAILAGRLTIEEALSDTRRRANIVVQDHVALGGQMRGDTPPDLGAEHLGREDSGSIMIRKLWIREIRALANGRSVKSWRHPGTQVWGTPLEILNIPV